MMRVEIIVRVFDTEMSHRPLHIDINTAGHARAVVHTLDVEFDVTPPTFPNETVWDLLRRVVEAGDAATGLIPHGRRPALTDLSLNHNLVQALHAVISQRDWWAVERAANRIRDDRRIIWPPRDGAPMIGVHEALQAWQDGEIGYLRAFELVGIATIDELYAAARSSGVEIKF